MVLIVSMIEFPAWTLVAIRLSGSTKGTGLHAARMGVSQAWLLSSPKGPANARDSITTKA